MKRYTHTLMAIALAATSIAPAAWAGGAPCMAPTPACAAQLPPLPSPPPKQTAPSDGLFMKAKKRDAFLTLYAQTAECMREASVAAMRYGATQRKTVVDFSTTMCGDGLHDWLLREEKFTEKQANALINSMGHKALAAALRGPDAIIIR